MAFWNLHNKWWKNNKSQASNRKQIQISKFKTKGFIYKNNILNLTMKVIEVVYEDGIFKPLEKVDLEEGEILIRVKKVEPKPDIQTTEKILSELDYLPRRKVNLKLAEELYHEGKISD